MGQVLDGKTFTIVSFIDKTQKRIVTVSFMVMPCVEMKISGTFFQEM